jgi:hypothetical protein
LGGCFFTHQTALCTGLRILPGPILLVPTRKKEKKRPCSADDDCEENATRPDQTRHKRFPNFYKKTFMKTGCLSRRLSRPVKSIRNLSPVNVKSKANKGKERHQKISAKLKEMLDSRTLSLARSIRRDTRPCTQSKDLQTCTLHKRIPK